MLSPPTLAFLDVGAQEMVVILVIALLMFGGKLPDVARTVGRTVGEFKRSAQGLTRDLRNDDYHPPIHQKYIEPRAEDLDNEEPHPPEGEPEDVIDVVEEPEDEKP